MRTMCMGLGLLWACAGLVFADDPAASQAIAKYQDAFNRRDVTTMQSMWAESAVLEDASAETSVVGRDAIIGQLKEVFAQDNPPKLTITTDSISVQADGSMQVSGTNTLTTSGTAEPVSESFAFIAVITSVGDKRLITRVTESTIEDDARQTIPAALQSIQWLIGTWTQDSGLVNEFRFMPGNQFVIRTFTTADRADAGDQADSGSLGYQIIGVLPGDDRLRSWTFAGDGSVFQAEWIVEQEIISIESNGRLSDGATASGTYVLKPLDENTMTMKVVGHMVSGEPMPSMGVVTLTRQPLNVIDSADTNLASPQEPQK